MGSVARLGFPVPMAGLPGRMAIVWVGPPLDWSPLGSSPGLATPTWLWLPSVLLNPPEPPVPIRLYEPDTVPSISLGDAPLFPATIVFVSVAATTFSRPPPPFELELPLR